MQKGKYLLPLLVPFFLFGGGAQLVELGTPALGLAGVGQAAEAQDASVAYYNPAGMPFLCEDALLVGGQGALVWGDVSTTGVPGLGAYWVHHFSEWASFGVSINTPYLIQAKYTPTFIEEAKLDLQFCAIDLNPAIAFRLNEWIMIGGGLVIEGTVVRMDVTVDDNAYYSGHWSKGWRTGFNAGVLFTFGCKTRWGVSYRSELSKRIPKDKDYTMYNGMVLYEGAIPFPQNVTLSLYHLVTDRLALLLDFGWAEYRMYNFLVGMNEYVGVVQMGKHFKDVWSGGAGIKYALCPGWTFQSGVMYGNSPIKKGAIELPIGAQWRWGTGVIYECRNTFWSTNVEYAYSKNINALFLNLTYGVKF